MKELDYVKVVGVDGNYRYGYIAKITERGFILIVSMYEEGLSKINFDRASNRLKGKDNINYISLLTKTEKRLIPLLASGYSTKKIAAEMSITPSTIRSHLRFLQLKLQLETRAQLVHLSQALEAMIKENDGS